MDICAFHSTVARRDTLTGEVKLSCFVQIKVGDLFYKELDFGSDHDGSVALHRVINAGVAALSEEVSK